MSKASPAGAAGSSNEFVEPAEGTTVLLCGVLHDSVADFITGGENCVEGPRENGDSYVAAGVTLGVTKECRASSACRVFGVRKPVADTACPTAAVTVRFDPADGETADIDSWAETGRIDRG